MFEVGYFVNYYTGDTSYMSLSLSLCIYIYIYIYIIYLYTLGQKYYATLKNEEKDIVNNLLIMKIRYMKDKIKKHLNLK